MTHPRLPARMRRLPLAHRGLHDRAAGRPENSRAAMQAAVAAGYGIELDLQLSRDNVAMVFHDDTLDRLTAAQGPVRARTAAELGRTGLRDADDGIPTLAEVLGIVAGRVPLLIELKDQQGALGPGDDALERATADALRGYAGEVALMSFNPHMVASLARHAPHLPRGLVTCGFFPAFWPGVPPARLAELRAIPDYDATGASFVSHRWQDLDDPRVAELAGQGADILCWTVRSEAEEAIARRIACTITFEGYRAALPAS